MRQFPSVLIQRQYRVNCQKEIVVELVCDRVSEAALNFGKVYMYMMDSNCGGRRFIVVPSESSTYKDRSMRHRCSNGTAQLIGVYDVSVHAKDIRGDVFFAMGW